MDNTTTHQSGNSAGVAPSPYPLTIALVAGEMSGDLLGSGLIREIKKNYPHAHFIGIGGEKMIAEGFHSLFPMERLSVMGIVDVLKRLPELLVIRHKLRTLFTKYPPAVFIGIDAPDFNLQLEGQLRAQGIKVVHYVSPSVWAWRQGRVKKIARAVDLMLTLFPFEKRFYERHNVPACFVGHPLADQIPLNSEKEHVRAALGYDKEQRLVALLPGSRAGEVTYLGPVFIEAAKRCLAEQADLQFIIPAANAERKKQILQLLNSEQKPLPVRIIEGDALTAMAASDAVLLASGTATLEAMLLKKPMVVAYRWHPLTHAIISRLVKTPFIALPNLLAEQALVPELVQEQASPERLAANLLSVMSEENERILLEKFTEIHHVLDRNSDHLAAQEILKLIGRA
ncbi:MAG TPA: lipid-A-disaccharide synthase [Pseudomonadales bacterium]|nr:lipid-A-disaccharide synthase [Pseudomonadales bacterium]